MVRASHWSSKGYRLYTYVTFTHHLSPCSSMVRASHWSSKGYKLYTYVTFTSPCSSILKVYPLLTIRRFLQSVLSPLLYSSRVNSLFFLSLFRWSSVEIVSQWLAQMKTRYISGAACLSFTPPSRNPKSPALNQRRATNENIGETLALAWVLRLQKA